MESTSFFSVAHINIYTSRLMETNQLKSEVHSIEERRDLDMLDMLDLDACQHLICQMRWNTECIV